MWNVIASLIDTPYVTIVCVVAWVLVMIPSICYLRTTWRNRREKLFDHFTADAVREYYKVFYPSRFLKDTGKEDATLADFRTLFREMYGWSEYVFPLVLLGLISALGLWATGASVRAWLAQPAAAAPYPAIAVSAFLGAYAWVLFDQIARFRSEDFTAGDVRHAAIRMMVSVPLGMSLAAFANEESGLAIAFLLTAFPTQTLLKMARRLVSKNLDTGDNEADGKIELEQLQGLGRVTAERFQDEGFTTIAALAWADPVKLAIESNRDFRYVTDTISQALLWLRFEANVRKLYSLSLRGAQEVCALLAKPGAQDTPDQSAASMTVDAAAKALDMDRKVFLSTLRELKEDPHAKFLYSIWRPAPAALRARHKEA